MTRHVTTPEAILLAQADGLIEDFLVDCDDDVQVDLRMIEEGDEELWVVEICDVYGGAATSPRCPDPVSAVEEAVDRYIDKRYPYARTNGIG